MAQHLSDLIRQGFARALVGPRPEQALACAHAQEPSLMGIGWEEMTSLLHRRSVPAARQDEILAATIRRYRAGPADVWAAVLLAMLAPAVIAMASRVRCSAPELDGEDLDQQAVLEALRACAEMPLPGECRFVQRRAVLLANKRLRRWAAREHRHLSLLPDGELMEICK